jgi:hypothetical protein
MFDKFTNFTRLSALSAITVFSLAFSASGEDHTGGVPVLNSRPGAEFTIYLNPSGFNFQGDFGSDGTPGFTPSLNEASPTGTFNAAEVDQIEKMWSRVAQSFIGMNVNVTTVDPAPAGISDAQRQAFYDAAPNMMHTVIGSGLRSGTPWVSGADGLSGLGVVVGSIPSGSTDSHTNFMLSEAQAGDANGNVINGDYIGAIIAHENAHAFSLYHQGDWRGAAKVNEYSLGDHNVTGPGSYVPIIGQASDRQRVTWRVGDTGGPSDSRTPVNDIQAMLAFNTAANAATMGRTGGATLHLVVSGIGHTSVTATSLPLIGSNVDNSTGSLARGVIVPKSESDPLAIGASNYTEDWFSFTLDSASTISLTVHNSTDFITAGVADGDGPLRSTLEIYDFDGISLIGSATEDASTQFATFVNSLTAGSYFAKIGSFGGHEQLLEAGANAFNAAQYFDMGAYFLSGSGFTPIPEPGSMIFVAFGMIFIFRRRR